MVQIVVERDETVDEATIVDVLSEHDVRFRNLERKEPPVRREPNPGVSG